MIGGLRSDAERARKTAKRSKRDKLLWECRANMFDKDAAAIATLLADRERLRLAVAPFAEAAECIDPTDPEINNMWEHPASMCVTVADYRRARAALSTQGEG